MSRSIRLSNNDYIDDMSIVHGRKPIRAMIDDGDIFARREPNPSKDFNDNWVQGIYVINNEGDYANAPTNGIIFLLVYSKNDEPDKWVVQEAIVAGFGGTIERYSRTKGYSAWSAWQRTI